MHVKALTFAGKNIAEATRALIMVHGRGGNAGDILSLAGYFNVKEYVLVAPQATNNSWYPNSFLAPPKNNEPWLSSALEVLNETVKEITEAGITTDHIYFLGFSQGACLTLEYVTRNASKYGGIVAFTGGLIGDKIYPENYSGNFENTPVFIGSSNPDPHVPANRVYATSNILKAMNANVIEKLYDNMGHTINDDEIEMANKVVFTI